MKKIYFTALLLLISYFSFSQNDTTNLILLHTNDMHSKIDNFDKLATLVKSYKNKYSNVWLFSAGDLFTGNPIVDQYKDPGYPIIQLMNEMPYDISCIGNHEFDYGQDILNKRIRQANFPMISANIKVQKQGKLMQPEPYYKFRANDGTTIGILGLIEVGKNGYPASSPLKMQHIDFENPFETAKKYKTYKDSTDIFICLTHLGYKDDLKLAEACPFFDIIIGGHSHTALENGEFHNNTFVVQAGAYLKYCGVLSLKVVNHKIVSRKDTFINLYNQKGDERIEKIIADYNNNPVFNEVIGYAAKPLSGIDELGSMMTDAMRESLKVDIAFQNNGGIRIDTIPQGNISIKNIFELSPFGNTFVTYKMCPFKLKKLIRYAYKIFNSPNVQVSGMQIEYIVKNNKLKKVILKDENGKKLRFKLYSVAINDYMASSYSLKFLKNGNNTGKIDASITKEFIKKHSPLNYQGVKRVFTKKQ